MLKLTFLLLMALMIIPGTVSGADTFSVQVGNYRILENAQKQFDDLQKAGKHSSEGLRIEKNGEFHAVRIGRFNDRASAERLLFTLKFLYSDAFVWKGETKPAPIVKTRPPAPTEKESESKGTSISAPPLKSKTEIRPEKKPKVIGTKEASLPVSQPVTATPLEHKNKKSAAEAPRLSPPVILIGTILEIIPGDARQWGMTEPQEGYRLEIFLENQEVLKNYPFLLRGQENNSVVVFAETIPSFFLPGKKVKLLVEDPVEPSGRFFWIKKGERITP